MRKIPKQSLVWYRLKYSVRFLQVQSGHITHEYLKNHSVILGLSTTIAEYFMFFDGRV